VVAPDGAGGDCRKKHQKETVVNIACLVKPGFINMSNNGLASRFFTIKVEISAK
jgi:hypothetical protein